MSEPTGLRLIAESADDLPVISAAVQDAVTKVRNIKYQAKKRRFSIELNRFRWEVGKDARKERVRSLLAFDGVLGVKSNGVAKTHRELIISVLSLEWAADDEPPGGTLTLRLAGDGEFQVRVEAIDVTLLDSEYVWPTRKRPDHEQRRR